MPPEEPKGARENLLFVERNITRVFSGEPTFREVQFYLSGYDEAVGFSVAREFHDWLVVQLGCGYEIHWSGLARALALGIDLNDSTPRPLASPEEDGAAARELLRIVIRFLSEIATLDGRRATYKRYEEMRMRDGLP